ncbi:MAG: hypothetical protein ACK49N_07045 [Verrucomicrobiota bacterium]
MKASSLHTRIMGRMACLLALISIFAACEKKTEESIGGKKTDDLAGYRKVEAPQIPLPEVINPTFADGSKGWNLRKGFRAAPGDGINQTGALFYERTDPADYHFATQSVKLLPGAAYRVRAMVKTDGVQGADLKGASVFVQFNNKAGKFLGGSYPSGAFGTSDWKEVGEKFTVPADADRMEIALYMRKGNTGKAWFTDVVLEPVSLPPSVLLLKPIQERFLTNDGKFEVNWNFGNFSGTTQEYAAKALETRVQVLSGNKEIRVERFPCTGLLTRGDLGSLPVGDLTLRLALLDPAAKTILHEGEFPVTCMAPTDIPANAVRVDAKGRTFVDGKPYLPVGLVMAGVQREDIARIGDSPFNCVMPYHSLSLKFRDTTKQGVEATREVLDACNSAGVKVIYSIKDIYENGTWYGGAIPYPKTWNGITGEKEIVTAVVEAFRKSPALLAWYIADENGPDMAPRLIERRRLIHQLDPSRSTYGAFYKVDQLFAMGGTVDVFGIDPYPVRDFNTNDMEFLHRVTTTAKKVLGGDGRGLPFLHVSQAHLVALYTEENGRRLDRAEDREKLLAKYRAPSEEEMRSMTLLTAIQGARSFLFYSYFDLLKPAVLPDFDRRWAELCRVAALLRELQPFLYSDETAPAVTVKTIQGTVNAAAYKTADGKVKVLVTGTGPGASEAEITVAGSTNLKARYGKTELLGGGTYRFKGTDICSDVLE